MKLLFLSILFCFNIIFAQQNALTGVWNANSEGDMDIAISVDETGAFDLAILPAFEFDNMTEEEQMAIISEYTSTKGHFKVLDSSITPVQTEILLNGEFSTNFLEITPTHIYIIKDESKELFMSKDSF